MNTLVLHNDEIVDIVGRWEGFVSKWRLEFKTQDKMEKINVEIEVLALTP